MHEEWLNAQPRMRGVHVGRARCRGGLVEAVLLMLKGATRAVGRAPRAIAIVNWPMISLAAGARMCAPRIR